MRLELFQDGMGMWRWRLRFSNSRVAATSEAYSSKRKAQHAARVLVRSQVHTVRIEGGGYPFATGRRAPAQAQPKQLVMRTCASIDHRFDATRNEQRRLVDAGGRGQIS
jgi:uncharacterized protein YegP (UPF0339 family)